LSTRDLNSLQLEGIPLTEHFSPEMLAIGLSTATQLKSLTIYFVSRIPHPDERGVHMHSPSPNRTVLPVLTEFRFEGVSEYLEDLVARLEAPSLQQINVAFFDELVPKIPQFSQFIGRTRGLKSPHKTSIQLLLRDISITQYFRDVPFPGEIQLQISSRQLGRRLASLTHICRQLFPLLSSAEWLDIKAFLLFSTRRRRGEIDPAQWLELFRHFQGVKTLELTGTVVPNIMSALEQLTGEMACGILPALRDLHWGGSQASMSRSIEPFITMRQLTGRPVSPHYKGEGIHDYHDEDD
jgi:hypothetical protein